ncbi:MAG TPA: hypothetical protein VK923_01150, partial [Euzebyales bacterium]|nr:hypothetical protein [Euzebyales bacterium]
MHYLTADQVEVLGDAMPEPYDLMVRFAAYTGLWSVEIAALRARHIRLDAGKVDVVTAVSEIHGALLEHDPKSYSSRRAVTLPALLVDLLREHLKDATLDTPVFTAIGGGPLRHVNWNARG